MSFDNLLTLANMPIQRFAKQCDQIVLRGSCGDLNDKTWVSEEERVLPDSFLGDAGDFAGGVELAARGARRLG